MNRYFPSILLLLGNFKGNSQDSISIRIKRCSRIILPFQNFINVKIKYCNTSDSINYLLYGGDIIETKKDTSQNYKDQRQGLSCAFTNRKGEFIYGFRQWISYRLSKLESVSKKNRKFSKKQYKNLEKDPLVLMPKQSTYRKYRVNIKNTEIGMGLNNLQILLIYLTPRIAKNELDADEEQYKAKTFSGISKTGKKFLFLILRKNTYITSIN